MGRFKRKGKRRLVRTVSQWSKPNYVPQVTIPTKTEEKPCPYPRTKKIIKSFYNSLKKRNKFGNLIYDYQPLESFVESDLATHRMCERIFHRGKFLSVGGVTLCVTSPRFFGDYWNKVMILSLFLNRKVKPFEDKKTISASEALGYFLRDELRRIGKDKPRIPNELVFKMRLATVFGIFAFLITVLALFTISPQIAYIYSFISCFIVNCFTLSYINLNNA